MNTVPLENVKQGEDTPKSTASSVVQRSPKLISIVIPCYNEELVVDELYLRLTKVMKQLHVSYELIFVNDGSHDKTLDKLTRLAEIDVDVRIINFSRNFGHQIAVTAGMEHAAGDVVILIDADLQDPPELIASFVGKWSEGYDVVYAVRQNRDGEGWFKKLTARAFYRLLKTMTTVDIPLDTGDFRLMSRVVVNSVLSTQEHHRFVRGLVSWVGFQQIGLPYERQERFAGDSKYPLRKMLRFAIDGITSFSTKPLQWASTLGFMTSGVGFLGILLVLYDKLVAKGVIQGWTSLMVVSIFLGGVQLLLLGVLGEYIGRIYDEVRGRPLYIVDKLYNFGSNTTPLKSEGDDLTR